jgi:hypothetical protein
MAHKTVEKSVSPDKIRVGQRVRFHRGVSAREAIVIEDRGPLDIGGGQVVRIRYFVDYAGDGVLEPVETETAARNVEILDEFPATVSTSQTSDAIIAKINVA